MTKCRIEIINNHATGYANALICDECHLFISRNISPKNNAGQEMAAPFNSYVACVVDYSLANNQIAKALIVLSVFIPVCL